jgi:BolA protein
MSDRPGPQRREVLLQRIEAALNPSFIELVDESYKHSVGPDAGTHWRCVVVSDAFDGKRLVQRHRIVYGALGDAMSDFVHAFSPKPMTPAEFEAAGQAVQHETPECLGGGKHG